MAIKTRSELIKLGGLKITDNEIFKTLEYKCKKCGQICNYFTPLKFRYVKCPKCNTSAILPLK